MSSRLLDMVTESDQLLVFIQLLTSALAVVCWQSCLAQ